MKVIEPLPVEVVHLIAAGEVIDSLAAVVRELVENALDAGATRIAVSLWTDQWRIRVADNGVGMSLADLKAAAAPHSTSKIRDRADLWKITSLGFRGEALHSLAQLSNLQIASCLTILNSTLNSADASRHEGWWVAYTPQGQAVQVEPMAIAPGTIITADQIFANLPARRQGLPPLTQQLRTVQLTIHQLSLCHPHVTWQVQQNDRDWFNLFPGSTARHILPQILRDVQVSDLQEFKIQNSKFKIQNTLYPSSLYVLLGLPDRCHRHRPDWVRVALNGRFVQLPEMEQTILAGFRRTLPRDRYPICFVHLQVPPDQIDWNRHPAKSEVYLHHLDNWREQVAGALDQALRLNPNSLPDTLYSDRIGKVLKTAEATGWYNINGKQDAEVISEAGGEQDSTPHSSLLTPHSSPPTPLKAVAQLHNMYILAEHPSGVWLIEQHIAHERVLYEQLCDRWQMAPLDSPIILNQLTTGQVEQLRQIGVEIEPFGEQTWIVRTAPNLLAQREDCAEALLELSLGGDLQTAQVATACRSAIRNGTPLLLPEMQTLLNQWQQTRNPRTCPHGRPICLTLEESSLSRFFRRHWVIGKSHGIVD
ncbi:MAG: DNA mismatch repair endonuclease MutL [Leptolyngbyaceae cyanobacterium RU_5_1]|nr:DNA mismatch repair endonuclease MutL [Leptolyngbyaceae cyanobacterium RU_5_1]